VSSCGAGLGGQGELVAQRTGKRYEVRAAGPAKAADANTCQLRQPMFELDISLVCDERLKRDPVSNCVFWEFDFTCEIKHGEPTKVGQDDGP
jgi:hypothetical protein